MGTWIYRRYDSAVLTPRWQCVVCVGPNQIYIKVYELIRYVQIVALANINTVVKLAPYEIYVVLTILGCSKVERRCDHILIYIKVAG